MGVNSQPTPPQLTAFFSENTANTKTAPGRKDDDGKWGGVVYKFWHATLKGWQTDLRPQISNSQEIKKTDIQLKCDSDTPQGQTNSQLQWPLLQD